MRIYETILTSKNRNQSKEPVKKGNSSSFIRKRASQAEMSSNTPVSTKSSILQHLIGKSSSKASLQIEKPNYSKNESAERVS